MSFMDAIARFLGRTGAGTPGQEVALAPGGMPVNLIALPSGGGWLNPEKMSVAQLWRTQPHLRTVVDFLAGNVAQLSLHAFHENAAGEQERDKTSPVAAWVQQPNDYQTMPDFLRAFTIERLLYDQAFIWVLTGPDGSLQTRVLPSEAVTVTRDAFGVPTRYEYAIADAAGVKSSHAIPTNEVIEFKGWTPSEPGATSSPVETLRQILSEQYYSWWRRAAMSKRGGRFQGFFSRPKDAPMWTDDDRRRWDEMRQAFAIGGERAGDDMLLEDGMTYQQAAPSAQETQWAESVTLSLLTICQVFHVNPTMVGVLDNANYSNVREFRRALYTDTLGPLLREIEARLSRFVLPLLGAPDGAWVQFNVEGKLRGSFEEQARVMSAAIGAPFMTRNEGRRMRGLPPVEGGDELITPLNVAIGGQASPVDGGDGRPSEGEKDALAVVRGFLSRQERSVQAKKQAGLTEWWQAGRWQKELTADLANAGVTDAAERAALINEIAYSAYVEGKQVQTSQILGALE